VAAVPAFAGSIEISDAVAHVEEDAEHGNTIEIFMNVTNSGGDLDRIFAIRSKLAGEGRIAGGGSKEDEHGDHEDHLLATSIDLPAGATTALAEDGSHLELAELKRTPQIGDEIKITLFFEQAGRINVTVMVAEEEH
jgi:copper(I)-binding protein